MYITNFKFHPVTLLFSAFLCLFSCSKEKLISISPEGSPDYQQVSERGALTISVKEARDWFTTAYGQQQMITNQSILPNKVLRVAPVWAFAQTATYFETPIVICPIQQGASQARFLLVLYRPAADQIAAQVVVFREINDTGVRGQDLKLGDFSGIIVSLNLQGNYVGKVHLIKNGVQFGEIDPSVNRNGFVNGNGSNGNVYYVQPVWGDTDPNTSGNWLPSPSPTSGTSSGGSWYVVGGTIHINVYGNPFSNGFGFGYTPIINPPAGGGSVTGPPDTNPLDNHFQNLLANPLYTFEQYLENNNLYGGTLAFLNNTAKTVLGNFTALIDPINDYVIAQNSSPESKALAQAHLSALASNAGYFARNQAANFPLMGTAPWAATLRLSVEGSGSEPPNAAEIALALSSVTASSTAILINNNVPIAHQYTSQYWGTVLEVVVNGKGDAFRHAFFLAMNAQINPTYAYLFGQAHETTVPTELALEKEMDLYNNNVGISYGSNNPLTTNGTMAQIINGAVLNGEMHYLSPLDWGTYPLTHGIVPNITHIIPTNQ